LAVAEMRFRGVVQFSESGFMVTALSTTYFPFYHLVITDHAVRIQSRWRCLERLLPSRSCPLSEVVSARQRGTFIIVHLPDDEWWTIGHTGLRATSIMREFESRGVSVTRD
jgi:hypothetical protein